MKAFAGLVLLAFIAWGLAGPFVALLFGAAYIYAARH